MQASQKFRISSAYFAFTRALVKLTTIFVTEPENNIMKVKIDDVDDDDALETRNVNIKHSRGI